MCKKWIVLMGLAVLLTFGSGASADLAGYWKLDEGGGTVAYDSSGNGNHGTLDGGPTVVDGQYGKALAFNNSRVTVPASDTLTGDLFRGDFTLSVWINPTRTGNTWQQVFRSIPTNNVSNDTLFINNDGHLTWRGFVGGTWTVMCSTSAGVVPANQWTHAAVVGDGTNFRIYVNGALSQESARQITDGANANYYIGGDPSAAGESYAGMADDVAVFDHVLTEREVQKAMAGIAAAELASNPYPENEAVDVPRDVVLSWATGEFAATHDVYFGTSFDDVNAATRANPMGVLASQAQTATTFDPAPGAPGLDFETTYYWRIDEVNAAPDNTVFKGEVWYFTTEPVGYAIQGVMATSNGVSEPGVGPENTVNGSGLDAADQHSTVSDDMWLASPGEEPLYVQYEFDRVYKLHELLVWNYNVQFELILGFGLKGVTLEYSENGTDWTALGDVEFAKATAKDTYVCNTVVDLQGVAAKYVRLTVNNGWGMMGKYGLSEVRFMYIPAQAREPQPEDGAADVDVNTSLSWRAGREAVSHEVYLGTALDALTLAATVDIATFVPGNLEFGSTYYWQIVEVNEADAVTTWASDAWSFTTQEYVWIDDFESYNDDIDAGTAIFDTWLDGWVNDTGSTVGYFNAPFAEKTVIHGGKQSMPLAYDNSVSPFYSEAWREFETAQDWSGNGADTLVLYVRGNAPGFVETAGGGIIMNGIGTDIWNNGDQFRYAYKSLSGNGSITVRVDSIILSNEWAKAGVMIRETLEAGSKHAFVALTPTPSHGISFQRRPTANAASGNTDVADIALPHWVKLTRTGNTFTAQQSEDGATWVDIVISPALDIAMAANVYIGLAVCSHDAAIVTGAEFGNVSTTGNVTGAWQSAEIGVAQPAGNSAEPMYVTIEDSAGKTKTVANADAAITARPSWQEWTIPYSDLSGVNLGRVEKMIIGIGSATAPAAGGTGTVYIDDIGFGSPATE